VNPSFWTSIFAAGTPTKSAAIFNLQSSAAATGGG